MKIQSPVDSTAADTIVVIPTPPPDSPEVSAESAAAEEAGAVNWSAQGSPTVARLRLPLMFERVAKKVGHRPRADRSGQDLDTSWRRHAACRDTDPGLFFPVGITGLALEQISDARRVCMGCSCQEACLEFALRSNQDTGIWGGASEEERRHLRRTYINKRN